MDSITPPELSTTKELQSGLWTIEGKKSFYIEDHLVVSRNCGKVLPLKRSVK